MSLEPPNYAEGSLSPRLDDSDITAPSGKMTRLTKKQPKLLSRSVSNEFDANLFSIYSFHLHEWTGLEKRMGFKPVSQ